MKRECDNPFGSHYDRVYLDLFRHYEEQERIKPEDKILETTSGSAGVSFCGLGKLLGYECHVVVPEGTDKPIIELIRREDGILYFTPQKDYIAGFPAFLKEFLPRHGNEFTFLNHSMGSRYGTNYRNNEITLRSLEGITREVLDEIEIDYFIPAVGNGSTILGPAKVLGSDTKVVVFESFQSAVAYDQLYPSIYETKFGIKPGSLPRHRLRGTSYHGIDFPHIKNAVSEKLIHKAILVSDAQVDENYKRATGRLDTTKLPHWDGVPADGLGKSTRAGIAVALDMANRVSDKILLIIAYDKEDRYDP